MPKVTRIAVQKHNKNRYSVFITEAGEEKYGFSVEEDTLISEGLKKDQRLDQSTINRLLKADNINKAYNQALNYLSYRMRSIKELKQYLLKKEIEPEQIDVIIQRLLKHQFLDDQAFADAYVSTKMKTAFKGPGLLKTELYQKGITTEQIDQALIQYHREDQVNFIHHWMTKQLKKKTRHSHRQTLNKMKQQLIQKGFDREVIDETFNQQHLEKDPDQEWQSLVYQGEKAVNRYRAKVEGYPLIQKTKAFLYQKGFSQEQIGQFIEQYLNEDSD